jgi:hypothetical protein
MGKSTVPDSLYCPEMSLAKTSSEWRGKLKTNTLILTNTWFTVAEPSRDCDIPCMDLIPLKH